MADVKWIKIVTDVFDDEKILLIETLPEADSIIVLWFKLLCLAGKQNNSGVFMLNDKMPYNEKMFAAIFRRKEATVQLAFKTFEDFGMIEIINGAVTIPNWGKHQTLDRIEQKKEYMRNYMRDYRDKQKQLINCKTNSKVNSKVNVSEADKDIDKDIDIDINKRKKESNATTFNEILSSYTSNLDLLKALQEYIKMRQPIRKPLTNHALGLALKKLDGLAVDDCTKISILEQSIMNSWQGLFPLKEDTNKSHVEGLSKWD